MSEFTFTLEDVKQSIEEQYGPVVIGLGEAGTATLIQAVRLPDATQDKLLAMQARFNEIRKTASEVAQTSDGEDDEGASTAARDGKKQSVELLEEMLTLVAKTDADAKRIIKACNHDLLVLGGVFQRYGKRSQLGEASASSGSSESTAGQSPQTSPSTTA
ncbi:hypothetical protein GCM10022234_00130 [Aeromicrobium panaciterrae]|uniref:phage tail assembly protein n=1 Tax=Aeromicrobium panaciterrae TaxID=363861 RepID=UPI0031D2EB68